MFWTKEVFLDGGLILHRYCTVLERMYGFVKSSEEVFCATTNLCG